MSVTPVSNIPLSVDYTGRDYYSLRESLIARIQDRIPEWTASDPSDFGVALVEAFAYMGDLIAFYIDRTANENFLQTATQRDSILNIAQTYGYVPAGYRQATADVTFSNSSTNNITIPEGTVLSGNVVYDDVVETVYFTTNADSVIDAAVDGVPGESTVSASHGRSVTLVSDASNAYGELVGTSNGAPNQIFELGETPVVDGSIELYIQDGDVYSKWSQVQHLLDYGPTDLVFTTQLDENDIVSVTFGDGVSGVIPILYSEVRVKYIVGGGTIGNISTNIIDTIDYIPNLSESAVTAIQGSVVVTNSSIGLGGSNPESNEQIRYSAPASLRSGNRAVTLKDFADLALSVSGVGKANATASVWTSVTLYISPSRTSIDTDPAPGLDDVGDTTAEYDRIKTDVVDFLENKTLIGTTVTVQPPTYIDAIIGISYTKLAQYTTAEVETALKQNLLTAFGYNGMNFEDTIYPQDIEFVLQQTTGIKTVKLLSLHEIDGSGLGNLVGGPGEIFRFKEENISLSEI